MTDGVLVLRAAAGLPSDCTTLVCDLDHSGTISGERRRERLRAAAELDASRCVPGAGDRSRPCGHGPDGSAALLAVEAPPVPASDAPVAITNLVGNTTADTGGTSSVTVVYATAADAARHSDASLVIATRTDGETHTGTSSCRSRPARRT